MPGLVPGIHDLNLAKTWMAGRDKAGHDGGCGEEKL